MKRLRPARQSPVARAPPGVLSSPRASPQMPTPAASSPSPPPPLIQASISVCIIDNCIFFDTVYGLLCVAMACCVSFTSMFKRWGNDGPGCARSRVHHRCRLQQRLLHHHLLRCSRCRFHCVFFIVYIEIHVYIYIYIDIY